MPRYPEHIDHDDQARPPAYRTEGYTYLVPAVKQPEGADGPGIGGLLSVLRRRRKALIASSLAALGLVVAVTFLTPKRYESTAAFLIEARNAGQSSTPALAVLERLGQANSIETELQLITSRRVIADAVNRLALNADVEVLRAGVGSDLRPLEIDAPPTAQPGEYRIDLDGEGWVVRDAKTGDEVAHRIGSWSSPEAGTGLAAHFAGIEVRARGQTLPDRTLVRVFPFDKVVDGVSGRISAKPLQSDARVVRLSCTAKSAAKAHDLCAVLSDAYLRLRLDLQRDEASAAAEFLGEQLQQVQLRLVVAEDSLEAYAVRNRAVALDEKARVEVTQNADLRARRQLVEAEQAALGLLLGRMDAGDPGSRKYQDLASFPTFVRGDRSVVSQLVETLVGLETRRNDLALSRSDANPDLRAVDTRITQIEEQLRSIASSYEQSLGSEIESLDGALASSRYQLSSIPRQQVATARLQRQVSSLEELYRFLQTRLREAEIAAAVQLPSVRIVDTATLPYRPSFPNVPLNLALGVMLALVAGAGVVGYQEHRDTSLRRPGEVADRAGVPILTMIPHLQKRRLLYAAGSGSNGRKKVLGRALQKKDAAAYDVLYESFRTLSVELGFAADRMNGSGMRSLCVTSSTRAEGKTTTACNLAIIRALQGSRTLLIDADLRGSQVGRRFSVPLEAPTLAGVLSEDSWSKESGRVYEQPLGDGKVLHILPSGDFSRPSSELLVSPALRTLLDSVTKTYDFVVVDTPPLNVLTDAGPISSWVDSVIVVVRAGHTDRAGLDLTLDRLRRAGARVTGVVLNDLALPDYYATYSREA